MLPIIEYSNIFINQEHIELPLFIKSTNSFYNRKSYLNKTHVLTQNYPDLGDRIPFFTLFRATFEYISIHMENSSI